MTHSSSQSTPVLCKAIKKNPIQTELKKTPPPCLTSKQIRQELGFLTRAQTSIIRKYQLLNHLFDHAGFFISVERKDSGHFQVSWCVSVRSRTSCLLCISVSLCFRLRRLALPVDYLQCWLKMITVGTLREKGSSAAVNSHNITILELLQLSA